jgi:hypothetical protein
MSYASALAGSQRVTNDEPASDGSGDNEHPAPSIAFQLKQAANDHCHATAGTEHPTPSTHGNTPPPVARLRIGLQETTDQDEEVQYTKRTCAESRDDVSSNPIPLPLNLAVSSPSMKATIATKRNLGRPCQRRVVVLLFHPIKHAKDPKAGCR